MAYKRSEVNPLLADIEVGRGGIGDRSASTASIKQAMTFPDTLMLQQEQSPAYKALHDAGLIVNNYRLQSSVDIESVPGNSSVTSNFIRRTTAWTAGLGIGGIIYDVLLSQFTVK